MFLKIEGVGVGVDQFPFDSATLCATLYICLESLIVVFSSRVLSLKVIPTKVSLTSPRGGYAFGLPCFSKKIENEGKEVPMSVVVNLLPTPDSARGPIFCGQSPSTIIPSLQFKEGPSHPHSPNQE